MSHEPYLELAASYALGALEADERSRFEAHLRGGCRECETTLIEYGESLATLAAELPPALPSPRVKAALIARIDAEAPSARERERPSHRWALWRWTVAGALATAAASVVYLGLRVSTLDRELAQRTEELVRLRAQVARQQEFLAILGSPETQLTSLAGLKPSPTARGRMWWLPGTGGYFAANGLPATPSGTTYQLWAIAAGKPVSAGIFDVDPKGSATAQVKPLPLVDKVEMFAVTLEPAGGLPQPSGEMYLAGRAL
jgi:anti-sigma-K factor RskA